MEFIHQIEQITSPLQLQTIAEHPWMYCQSAQIFHMKEYKVPCAFQLTIKWNINTLNVQPSTKVLGELMNLNRYILELETV